MKKVIAVLLTIIMTTVICVSFTACEEEIPAVEVVVEDLVAAQADIESYEMEMVMTMKMVMDMPEEDTPTGMPMDVDVTADFTSAMDNIEKEMKMVVIMEMAAPDEDPMKIDIEMYYVDGWMYAMMDMPLMSPQWMKSEIPYDEFLAEMGEMDFTESQIEMLKEADAKITGIEKVDGVNCYVIELTPDMGDLWDMVMQQAQMTGEEMPDIPMDNINEMFRSFSVKYWIAKDTYFLVKSDMDMDVEITPEAMGMPDEEGSILMDVTMSMRMFNYNETVSIVLPPEAEGAVQGSMW